MLIGTKGNSMIVRSMLLFVVVAMILAPTPMLAREIVAETKNTRFFSDHSIERKVNLEKQTIFTEEDFRSLQSEHPKASASEAARLALVENAVPGLWKGFGGVPYGCNGSIDLLEEGPGGKIYIAGEFTACNEVVVNNIAVWDPITNTFEPLGSPPGTSVGSEIWDMDFAPNGDLIVVGRFSRAGSEFAPNVARWDGSSWSRIGQDFFNSTVAAVEIDPISGDIYVGGFFTQLFLSDGGSLQVNRIAVWDGSAWTALGAGLDGTVRALKFVGGTLYVGGDFSQAGAQPAQHIASWDGAQWSALGVGTDRTVSNLETDGTNLFVGGFFISAGGISTGSLAQWDGSQWSSIDGPCCFGAMDFAAGKLFVTGGFSQVGGVSMPRVAIWDGSSWTGTADPSAFRSSGTAIWSNGNDILVGGRFSVIGTFAPDNYPAEGTFANRIARFDSTTQQWGAIGNGEGANLSGEVNAITQFDGEVWVAGSFTAAGLTSTASGLARWNGNEWSPAPSDSAPCGSIRQFAKADNGDLLAVTSCFSSGGVAWRGTARFDGSTWSPVGEGLDGSVQGVEVDPETGDIYYTGNFTASGDSPPVVVNRIAQWDGAAWSSVGDGPDNGVSNSSSSFASIGSAAAHNGNVMVEGSFDRAGTIEVDDIALWDGIAWSQPGQSLQNGDFSPFISQVEGQGTSVFAAGVFNRSGMQSLRNIAEWDGTSWHPLQGPLGEGLDSTSMRLAARQDFLYVGGFFTEAGGRPANRIARWDGADWQSLGAGGENGLRHPANEGDFPNINAILPTSAGIFVGGRFGGSASVTSPNLIRFDPSASPDEVFKDGFEDFLE